ncbi:unnamed protein product [Spirodela intermedia]|uniref:U-box domain-containing protein n=1 Tax=Spirodela intermedia TaxID=51605 RepID=A0A7I8JBZ3_SPIIN|nr:unnamed protein product [Spirodela intermedia]CAA6667630.1 unnamed protein product [Spirodela intermedia]
MEEKGVDVPSYFLCPISLQIMRDPVTVCTGITYDRDSIEKWIFSGNRRVEATCPAWCVANASYGVERLPTPRIPLDKAQIAHILNEARRLETQLDALRKLRSLVIESDRNRRCVEAAGAPDFLISVIRRSPIAPSTEEEALGVLHALQISPQGFIDMIVRNEDLVELLIAVMQRSNYQSRAYATFLLRSLFEAASPVRFLSLKDEFFTELVKVLRDRISFKATKVALRVLAMSCPWGRNRVKATDAGAVPVLVELLLDDPEKRACEMALVVLDQLCCCAEARRSCWRIRGAGVLGHAGRTTGDAADRRCRQALPSPPSESGNKTTERAASILRLHSKTWKKSPCIPQHLLSSYPSH